MAEISLRSYNREIKELIDSGDTQNAILHCEQILEKYPLQVDINRLLGEAFLENKDYEKASEKFQQVLSSIPEDFPAHVGMSILREEQQCIDEACWHMERAFEIQPASNSIRDELRRLFTRRDGIQVDNIPLNRGALARLYIKGGLFTQAVSELFAALKEDNSRFDLRSLLAQVLYHTGQEVQAASEAELVLSSLPFCLAANRVMAEFYKKRDQTGNYDLYLQKVKEMDPYLNQPDFFTSTIEPLSDDSIVLEKLLIAPPAETAEVGLVEGAGYVEVAESLDEEISAEQKEVIEEIGLITEQEEQVSETGLQPVQHSDWEPETFVESLESEDTRPLQHAEMIAKQDEGIIDSQQGEVSEISEETSEIPDWLLEIAETKESPEEEIKLAQPEYQAEAEKPISKEEILPEPVLFDNDSSISIELSDAREQINKGQISDAIQLYDRSIKDRSSLPAVIADLELIREKHPDNSEIWRKLGDAYLRNQQIGEAMQAYTRAEELSR